MKKINLLLFSLLIGAGFSLQSCLRDTCEREVTYILTTPIYKTVDEVHNGTVVSESPRELCQPGKIYYYNDFLFINEGRDGVHVIDNSVPSNPRNIAFIAIPGSEDIAIKNGRLLANSYTDLLSIDIDDVYDAKLIARTENVFPPIWEDLNNDRILVYYESEEITEVLDCETINLFNQRNDILFFDNVAGGAEVDATGSGSGGSGATVSTGISGSMARFSIVGDYLYVVDNSSLHIFDITGNEASLVNTVNVGWGIETIFPYEDNLFIGSNTGMFIFDNSNPTAPTMMSSFAHISACDPVFIKDDFAYVTLRSGNACQGFSNQLDLIDISELTDPQLVKTFPMENPHGLSIKGNNLFLCEGSSGIKAFDIEDPEKLDQNLLDRVEGFDAYDVIALPGAETTLLVIGKDGFYQFDANDPTNMKRISTLNIQQDCK